MARLKLSRIAVAAALACGASTAWADPFSLIGFGAAAAAAGAFGSALTISATTAFWIASGSSLLGALFNRRKAKRAEAARRNAEVAAYNASLTDRNVTVMNTEAPWQVVYGSPAPIGGAIVGIFTSGARDEYKHLVIVFAAHECEAIDEVYIDGEPVGALNGSGWCTAGAFYEQATGTAREDKTVDGSGVVTLDHTVSQLLVVGSVPGSEVPFDATASATVSGNTLTGLSAYAGSSVRVRYTYADPLPRVNVQKHLSPGGVDTADAFLMARTSEWTSAHKLSGFTYVVLTLDLNLSRFQGAPPNVTAKLRGKKVYDWRTSTTAYSANPALCIADFICSEYGFGASTSQIDEDAVIAAANACDVEAYVASDATGNTTELYRCDGAFTTAQDRESTLQQLEDSCAGSTHESGGVWRIMAGAWTAPVMALTDADFHGPVTIEQASYTSRERFNGARGTYIDWRNLGVSGDFPPYSNSTYVTADGVERITDLSLPFTHSPQRAVQLARVRVEQSRGGLVIRIPAHMRCYGLQPSDRVTVTHSEFGFSAKNFRVADWGFDLNSPVILESIEDEESFYDLADDVSVDAAPNTNLPDPFTVPALTGLTAESGTDQLLVQTDGTIITRVRLAWNGSTNSLVAQGGQIQVQYQRADTDDADVWQSVPPEPGEATSTYLLGLEDGTTYLLRARFVNSMAIRGGWSVIAHQVIGKTEPPDDVDNFTIDGNTLRWTAVDAADLAGYRIRFNYGNNSFWGSGAALHEGLLTSSPYEMTSRPSGVVTFLIKAVDTSGNESDAAAVIVTDLGDAEIANILIEHDEAPDFTGTITNGAVSGGVLQASATDLFYGDDNQPFYGPDEDPFYATGTFAQMQYEFSYAPSAAGRLLLQHTIAASDYVIEYKRDSQDAFYGNDADLFYGPDEEPFYGTPGAWQVWPGVIELQAPEQITWRITTAGGPTQGQVSVLTVVLDVPDVTEDVNDLVVSPGGTRVPLTESYRAISNVQITLQTDGSGGTSVRYEDKDNVTDGPLVIVTNAAGTSVAGLVDVSIKGY